ncbi:oxidoreductase domain-containing protein [Clathrospora elynae]|uniref:D-xylose 1-dehydrogenase (NADP(+), D-xylono-1,5-lactone-forming) n=1 Tax=Clathrospora elynae TaxID=706981 RepID=A0A6A5SLM0_9PLEO|nr:oxidoreductase domain-containing protein [Clathrospora elynae]
MPFVDWLTSFAELGEWMAGRKEVVKKDNALRFGILGAANITPTALTLPARSHAEVLVVAVAARDKKKAEAYAKRYGIPIVHDSYDALINDPSIDCIYNPLPNGLHYHWTLKALKAGKHVLLEKPSVSNAEEARSLFHHPVLQGPNAPILVEASHYRFHPAWSLLLSLFNRENVEYVNAHAAIPAGIFPGDDIRFNYPLAGGTLMDVGHYTLSALRSVYGTEPVAVTSATPRLINQPFDQRCDQAMVATYMFPNSGTGKISADLGARGGYWFPWLTGNWPNLKDSVQVVSVTLKEQMEDVGEEGVIKGTRRQIKLWNFMLPHMWHRIDIVTTTTYRDASGKTVKEEKSTENKKAYKWPEGSGGDIKGEDWWSTYRYQLEEFVNKVKGREGSGVWVDGEESIRQMECTDRTYEKAGMLLRPTSEALE